MNLALIPTLFLVLPADGGGGGGTPDPDWVGANDTSGLDCDDDDDDEDDLPEGVVTLPPFEQHEADPLGGYWWVRLDPGMTALEDQTLELVGLERDVRYPVGYREEGVWLESWLTADLVESHRAREYYGEEYTVLALRSPSDAVPGESFELRRLSATLAVLGIRQEATPPATFESLSITVDDIVPAKCDARCRDDGISIPRSPVLRIDYRGDPVVLDMRLLATCDDLYASHIFIDAFALTATDDAILVVDPRDFPVQGDCVISHDYTTVYDPDTHAALVQLPYDDVGPLEAAPTTLYENGEPVEREECAFLAGTIWDSETRMRDYGLPCACVDASSRVPICAFVALALPMLTLRRRHRRPTWAIRIRSAGERARDRPPLGYRVPRS